MSLYLELAPAKTLGLAEVLLCMCGLAGFLAFDVSGKSSTGCSTIGASCSPPSRRFGEFDCLSRLEVAAAMILAAVLAIRFCSSP